MNFVSVLGLLASFGSFLAFALSLGQLFVENSGSRNRIVSLAYFFFGLFLFSLAPLLLSDAVPLSPRRFLFFLKMAVLSRGLEYPLFFYFVKERNREAPPAATSLLPLYIPFFIGLAILASIGGTGDISAAAGSAANRFGGYFARYPLLSLTACVNGLIQGIYLLILLVSANGGRKGTRVPRESGDIVLTLYLGQALLNVGLFVLTLFRRYWLANLALNSSSAFVVIAALLFAHRWPELLLLRKMEIPDDGPKELTLAKVPVYPILLELNDLMAIKKLYTIPGLTQKQVADRLVISVKQFSDMLSQYWGMNFQGYLNGIRIIEAKRRIICGEGSITEILHDVGYNGISTFNTAFKNSVGMSPSEFRKKCLGERIAVRSGEDELGTD